MKMLIHYYSPRTKISEIQQAIIWVGYDALLT